MTDAAFDALPAGYFKVLGAGSVTAAHEANRNLSGETLDAGSEAFTGTLMTLWGKVPIVDRAYVIVDADHYQPAEIVDLPGATFEVRVKDFDVPPGNHSTRIALFNDHGADYLLDGPAIIRTTRPLTEMYSGSFNVQDWNAGTLDLPWILDRATTPDARYRVAIDFHDGSPVTWTPAKVQKTGPLLTTFRSIAVHHDLVGTYSMTVTLRRTTGRVASFATEFDVSAYGLTHPDVAAPPPVAPAPSTLPDFIMPDSRRIIARIGDTLTSLGTFSSKIPLPSGTTANVQWTDQTRSQASLRSLGRYTPEDGGVPYWRYAVDISARHVQIGSDQATLELAHGNDRSYSGTFVLGLDDGLTPGINRGSPWGFRIAEGVEKDVPLGGFWDKSPTDDGAYCVRLVMADGTIYSGHVESSADEPGWKLMSFRLPAMWSENGTPVRSESEPIARGTLTITRPGASLSGPVDLMLYDNTYVAAADITPDSVGLPKTLRVKRYASSTVFNNGKGGLDVDLKTQFDIDPADLQVRVRWDRNHTSKMQVIRTSAGKYRLHADHVYKNFGVYAARVVVRYGDTKTAVTRDIYVGKTGSDQTRFLLTKNPVVDNAYAGVNFAELGTWFGAAQFIDSEPNSQISEGYYAQMIFDDGTPAKAYGDVDPENRSAQRVFFTARFDTAGSHPFTLKIWDDFGKPLIIRGIAEVLSHDVYTGSVAHGNGGVLLNEESDWRPPAIR